LDPVAGMEGSPLPPAGAALWISGSAIGHVAITLLIFARYALL
jgi:hypothetical protein